MLDELRLTLSSAGPTAGSERKLLRRVCTARNGKKGQEQGG
jgi:hypothetical protein